MANALKTMASTREEEPQRWAHSLLQQGGSVSKPLPPPLLLTSGANSDTIQATVCHNIRVCVCVCVSYISSIKLNYVDKSYVQESQATLAALG